MSYRKHALDVLGDFFDGELSRISTARNQLLSDGKMESRSLSRFNQLTFGTVRRYRSLDSVIQAFSDAPLKRLHDDIHEILRLGLYEILFFDSIPSHATVNEYVELAKSQVSSDSGGFVNAVLRSMLRDLTDEVWEYPDQYDQQGVEHLFYIGRGRAREFQSRIFPAPFEGAEERRQFFSRAFNIPEWICRTWIEAYGVEDAFQIACSQAEVPDLYVRRNPMRVSEKDFESNLEEDDISFRNLDVDPFYKLEKVGSPSNIPGFDDGHFTVQDPAIGLVVSDLQPETGDRILDLCAAPGGKTGQLVEQLNGQSSIVSVDHSQRRFRRFRENQERLGWEDTVSPVLADARQLPFDDQPFDRVLLDVPCSNTAVLSRRVEARYHLTDGMSEGLVDIQKQMLDAALDTVKPGGALLYATCSLLPEENEALLGDVLEHHPDVRLSHPEFLFPGEVSSCGSFSALIEKPAS